MLERFLQFSSSNDRITCDPDGVCRTGLPTAAQNRLGGSRLRLSRPKVSHLPFYMVFGHQKPSSWKSLLSAFGFFCLFVLSQQEARSQTFFVPSDTFNQNRFITLAASGAVVYGSAVVGFNQVWYRGFDRTSFHFFNDWGEWNNMDKMGHMFTTYFETELSYRGCRWAGMQKKSSIWLAPALGILYQSTIELFDAHSSGWGFSTYDMLYNLAGTGLFVAQEAIWDDQRIRMKVSSWPKKYPNEVIFDRSRSETTSLRSRTDDLFGTNFFERYLKDYNAQTIWLSVNIRSFAPNLNIPPWLNLGVGYGTENLFGGFANQWSEGSSVFSTPPGQYKRYRQWYLSPDVDFRKIKTNSPLLKTVFNVLNIFKIPAPTLEYNTNNKWKWHWIFL